MQMEITERKQKKKETRVCCLFFFSIKPAVFALEEAVHMINPDASNLNMPCWLEEMLKLFNLLCLLW